MNNREPIYVPEKGIILNSPISLRSGPLSYSIAIAALDLKLSESTASMAVINPTEENTYSRIEDIVKNIYQKGIPQANVRIAGGAKYFLPEEYERPENYEGLDSSEKQLSGSGVRLDFINDKVEETLEKIGSMFFRQSLNQELKHRVAWTITPENYILLGLIGSERKEGFIEEDHDYMEIIADPSRGEFRTYQSRV